MRIVHVRREFCRLTETFVHDVVTDVAAAGHDTHVVCFRRIRHPDRGFPDGRVHVVPRPSLLDPGRLRCDLLDLGARPDVERRRRLLALGRVLDRLQPDLVHAHFGREGVMAASWTRRHGVPLVVSHHGYDISEMLEQPAWRAAYRRLWKHAAAITVVSTAQRERLLALGVPPDRLHLLRVGKRLRDYPFHPRTEPVRRVASMGRLTGKKGHDDALRALAIVNGRLAKADRLSLTIIGEGPDEAALRQLATTQGIEDQVRFVGALPHDAAMTTLQQADAFVLCSKTTAAGDQEGVPVVLMEAQALGLPCVSTRHAGIPDGIAPRNHDLLAAEGDVDALASRLETLRAMPADERAARAAAGREHVERHFDRDRTTAQLLALYVDVARASVRLGGSAGEAGAAADAG